MKKEILALLEKYKISVEEYNKDLYLELHKDRISYELYKAKATLSGFLSWLDD